MKYFKSHSDFLNEARLSKVHKAAKKGSYPVSLVVIENGKVVKQELVGTPQIVPAAFNQLKKEYPNATVHVESKTGERLFSESVVTEGILKISGVALDLWDEKENQRELRDVKIKIIGDIGGVLTIKGNDKELQKVKDILGLEGAKESVTNDLIDRIGDLDDTLTSDRKAEREWEEMSQNYLDGQRGSEYWGDLGDQELQDAIDDAESLMKKYRIKESVNEAKFTKKSLMRAMKKDDGMIQLGNGQEYVIYNPNNGNDDNADMWQDKVIFGLDQDGEEHEIEYSDIVRYDESVLNEDNLNYKDTGLKGGYLRDVKNAVKAIKNALKAGNKKAASRVTIPNYDIIQQRVQQYGLGPNRYDFLDAVKKLAGIDESEINEATDLNDPVLVAYRATSRDLPKLKIPKLKSRRLSFDKYMDLLDARLDIDQQIKDLRDEMAQTLRDMEQEAEPEGGEVADRYGSTMMKQEKEYTKLMAKKDKIMARIDKHRMA